MPPEVSVVLPAYNPDAAELTATLASLRAQTLPPERWELLLVDNGSAPPVDPSGVAWHPRGSAVREESPGLVAARATGFVRSQGDIIVVVDQDNVLAADYLSAVLAIAGENPRLGVWGAGIISPRYERPELAPPPRLRSLLTLRSAAAEHRSRDISDHDSTPWGAGLCVRRRVATAYLDALKANPLKARLDLRGRDRLSGGDTDIAYTACSLGFEKGVFPRLRMEHLIPAGRCTAEFLCRTAEGRGYSEILHHLVLQGRLPPPQRGLLWTLRRWRRRLRLTSLERRVDRAHEAGRRRAHRELATHGA